MRRTSRMWRSTLTAAHQLTLRVDAERAGHLVYDLPVTGGQMTFDDGALLRRRLTLTLPVSMPDGRSWDPGTDPAHPLGCYGQRLRVRMGVEHADGTRELLNMGQVLINTWDVDETGEAVEVEAVDLAQLIADAKHYTIETPAPGTTYAREFERLAAGILPVRIADGLSLTATVNAATIWARERDKNLTKLCKAWGARWYVDDDGYLTAAPAYPDITDQTPPVVHLTGGTNGTVVARARSGTRERLYNAVVVTGRAVREDQATTEPPVPWAAAEVRDPRSPIRIDGPYGRRPKFYTSEMLTTSAECQATAIQMLAAASGVSRTEPVACVPDPSMDLGDVVRVVTRGIPWTGRVQSFALPLTAAGGSMKVVVSNAPAANEDTPES